jgi:hypothetical protein
MLRRSALSKNTKSAKAEAGWRDLEVQGVASDQNSHCTLVSEHKRGCCDGLPGGQQTSKYGTVAAERETYIERPQA